MRYNLAYTLGWSQYIYDNGITLKTGNTVLLEDNPMYTTSLMGGFINIHRFPQDFNLEDIALDIEGLSMPSIDWTNVKGIVTDLSEEYFQSICTQYIDTTKTEPITLVLNSPYVI